MDSRMESLSTAHANQPPTKRACRRMKSFIVQHGINKQLGFFKRSKEAPQLIEVIGKGTYPLVADARKAGKTSLKQEIIEELDGGVLDTVMGRKVVRGVAVTLGWGLTVHGQASGADFWRHIIDNFVEQSHGLLIRQPDTTDSAAGFASLFQWAADTDPLIVVCVDEASELAKVSDINRTSFLQALWDLRESATGRQSRLLSVAFFGTFTLLRIIDEWNEGRPVSSGALFSSSETGPAVIRGLQRFSIDDILELLEEYAELCEEVLVKRPVALQVLRKIAQSIFEETKGHKGQTIACLMALQTRQLLEQNLKGSEILEQWLQYLWTGLPGYVARATVFQGTVESVLEATPAQHDLLRRILNSGTATVPTAQMKDVVEPLLAEGVLVEEIHGESGESGYKKMALADPQSLVTLAFSSPLIAACICSNGHLNRKLRIDNLSPGLGG